MTLSKLLALSDPQFPYIHNCYTIYLAGLLRGSWNHRYRRVGMMPDSRTDWHCWVNILLSFCNCWFQSCYFFCLVLRVFCTAFSIACRPSFSNVPSPFTFPSLFEGFSESTPLVVAWPGSASAVNIAGHPGCPVPAHSPVSSFWMHLILQAQLSPWKVSFLAKCQRTFSWGNSAFW